MINISPRRSWHSESKTLEKFENHIKEFSLQGTKLRHFTSKFYQVINQTVFLALVTLLTYFCEAR